ncbi:hypothetical protein FB451DRAFT_1529786, partial [Mycena latifolia]
MRALPPQILQEIFLACLPTSHHAVMHTSQAPLLFGRVCSAWRTISLSTPALWASVHVVLPYASDQPPPDEELLINAKILQRCEALRIWLQRSGDCPLSISLWYERHLGIPPQVLEAILPRRRRLKALKLPHEVVYDLCHLSPEDLPLVQVLDIDDTSWEPSDPEYVRFLAIPPNLGSISFRCQNAHPLPVCSWSRVTHLTLQSRRSFFTPDLAQTLELLAQSVNLQKCVLEFPPQRV